MKFKSCYITTVDTDDPKDIVLKDSARNSYVIHKNSPNIGQFKKWLTEVFCKGIPQYLTVFSYDVETNESDPNERLEVI